jgi:hypothetical protein
MAFLVLIKDYNWESGKSLLIHVVYKYLPTVGILTKWDNNISMPFQRALKTATL